MIHGSDMDDDEFDAVNDEHLQAQDQAERMSRRMHPAFFLSLPRAKKFLAERQ